MTLWCDYKRILAFSLLLAAVAGCSSSSEQDVLTMKVSASDFVFSVPAKGELISAKEISVNAPAGNRGQLTLAWMAEENSHVKAGDVVAKFDGTEHELEKQRAELELEKNQLTQAITSRDLDYGQFSIGQQTRTVVQEKQMVERFSVDDLTVYSKNEIIDQLLSKEYLVAQALYLDWRQESQLVQGDAQLQLLNLQGRGFVETIELSAGALDNLEVLAPADGVFIHAKNWRGEKVRVGQSLWPGSRLGSLPSLQELQARLFVLETEAAGIEIGLPAEIILDAYVDRVITGKTVAVANIATQQNNSNPTKYFEVTVALDESDAEFMRPGQKLEGTIYIARKADVISVPNQAVFQSNGEFWVYIKRGRGFVRQSVNVGLRSLTRTEIISGLEVGDEIALLRPQVVSS